MLVSLVNHNRLGYTEMPLLATGLDFQVNTLNRGSLDQMSASLRQPLASSPSCADFHAGCAVSH